MQDLPVPWTFRQWNPSNLYTIHLINNTALLLLLQKSFWMCNPTNKESAADLYHKQYWTVNHLNLTAAPRTEFPSNISIFSLITTPTSTSILNNNYRVLIQFRIFKLYQNERTSLKKSCQKRILSVKNKKFLLRTTSLLRMIPLNPLKLTGSVSCSNISWTNILLSRDHAEFKINQKVFLRILNPG
jgi:hypothetical protein